MRKGKLSNKNRSDRQIIKVVTRWDYTEEVSPAFKRLMMLLLKPPDSQSAEIIRADAELQNE